MPRSFAVLFLLVAVQLSAAQSALSPENTFTVATTKSWVDTGIDLKTGDVVTIAASESPESPCDPRGNGSPADTLPVPSGAPGALIARLSAQDLTPLLIGASKIIPVSKPGRLFIRVNNSGTPPKKG